MAHSMARLSCLLWKWILGLTDPGMTQEVFPSNASPRSWLGTLGEQSLKERSFKLSQLLPTSAFIAAPQNADWDWKMCYGCPLEAVPSGWSTGI